MSGVLSDLSQQGISGRAYYAVESIISAARDLQIAIDEETEALKESRNWVGTDECRTKESRVIEASKKLARAIFAADDYEYQQETQNDGI